ncbi:MAG TPA: alpha/beta hydrolase domain-containing protein [Croceibacterium sp.]|nr:alpha/beta hydrolase domain-containing protein [Croceibacterium sp.]
MMKRHRIAIVLAGSALLALGAQASAEIRSVEGPIPFSAENPMFGPADFPGAKLGIALKPFGYVEEEYFIQGTAAAYEHTANGPRARTGKLPYTTRIVIRRPADPARFSGVVHYEPIHPTQGYNGQWMVLGRYLMSRGDIYVFAGVGDASQGQGGSPNFPAESGPIGQNRILKWFNPERYAAISWPEEEGIRYEIMGEIGKKLRSNDADNPLRGLDVKAMLVGGWSYTGSIQRTYINEGFHEMIRLPDGRPVFDGYLVGVSSAHNNPGYLSLYNDEPFVPLNDPRRVLRKTDAKVIEFLTEAEVEMGNAPTAPNVPDSDERIGAHRVYELAGVIHTDSLHDPNHGSRERPYAAQLIAKGYRMMGVSSVSVANCPLPQSDIPQAEFVRGAVDNLRHWVLDGTLPPRAEPLRRENGKLIRDSAGNILGGIRAAEYEVPLARYGRYQGDTYPTCRAEQQYPNSFFVRDPLTKEELVSRYGTPERYLALYDAEVARLIAQRWLLPEDGLRLKAEAREWVADGF